MQTPVHASLAQLPLRTCFLHPPPPRSSQRRPPPVPQILTPRERPPDALSERALSTTAAARHTRLVCIWVWLVQLRKCILNFIQPYLSFNFRNHPWPVATVLNGRYSWWVSGSLKSLGSAHDVTSAVSVWLIPLYPLSLSFKRHRKTSSPTKVPPSSFLAAPQIPVYLENAPHKPGSGATKGGGLKKKVSCG